MTKPPPLTELFLSSLGETPPMGDTTLNRLEETLDVIVGAARSQWPTLTVAPERFLPYLAERLPASDDLVQGLSQLQTGDLYLACGCAAKEAHALELFEQHFGDKIAKCLAQYKASFGLIQDVRQLLLKKLFVADGSALGDIAKYSGRGTLASWIRVTTTHMALRFLRDNQREIPDEDKILHVVSSASEDPELEYMKHFYKERFRQAFHQAMASLTPRDRNLLRQRILDGMTIDEIGALYNVHRVTASRWLVNLRQTLADKTRDFMIQGLDISDYEYESIVRIIRSQLDFTISRYLAAESRKSGRSTSGLDDHH